MTRWRWHTALCGATVLALAMSTVAVSAAEPPPNTPGDAPAPASTTPPAAGSTTITLITGDVVTYQFAADGTPVDATVEPAARPTGYPVLFSEIRDGQSYYVYPSDAVGLVEAGKLDRRLFDVAYQAEVGYTDDRIASLPLIVQNGRQARAAANAVEAMPVTTNARALPAAQGVAVSVAKKDTAAFWSTVDAPQPTARTLDAGVSTIWLDGMVEASLDQSVAQIGAPEAWAAGFTGKGVTVAVLDSGVDPAHPDLVERITGAKSFVPDEEVQDKHGHGTHVASTIAGSGAAADGKYRGVAPDADLLIGKVLNNAGNGTESGIIEGMTWAAEQGADVINMSLGGCCTDGTDPMSQAVNALSEQYQTLFVIAAGNDTNPLTIGAPGTADAALTVAAVDRNDTRAGFSSRGPRQGDYALKPDLAGPGVGIVAARAEGTALGTPVNDRYTALNGTSMATPHVAGAAAILAQQHPDWTPQQLKSALVSSVKQDDHGAYETGSGRLDVARAVRQGVFSSGNVDFGTITYPHPSPATRTITYTNTTDQPVTLTLTAEISTNTGEHRPGALSVPESVTVPANGSAPVTVAFDTTGPNLWYQGSITAVAGDLRLHNAVGGYLAPQRHRMAANIVLPHGATDVTYQPWYIVKLDDEGDMFQFDNQLVGNPGQSIDGSLDEGTYMLQTAINWRDAKGNPQLMLLVDPKVEVKAETIVTLDARKARKIDTRVPRSTVHGAVHFGYQQTSESGERDFKISGTSEHSNEWGIWATPTEKVDRFVWYDQRMLIAPLVEMSVGRLDLDARYLGTHAQEARFDGRDQFTLVSAGRGVAEDYAGKRVRGKVVLIDLTDLCPATEWTCSTGVQDRLTVAHENGAVGVVAYGGARQPVSIDDARNRIATPVPAVTVPPEQGRSLAAQLTRRDARMSVRATAQVPYLYSLSYPSYGQVPANLDHRVSKRDLYEYDARLHADAPGTATLRWGSRNKPAVDLGGTAMTMRVPATFTEYVGPLRPEEQRFRTVSVGYDAPADMDRFHTTGYQESRMDVLTKPGRRIDRSGAAPLVHSATRGVTPADNDYGASACTACRSGNIFMPWHLRDNNGYGGGTQTYQSVEILRGEKQTELRLWGPDGKEVPVQQGAYIVGFSFLAVPYFDLPDEWGRYRMTENYPTPYKLQKWARQVNTEWTFETGTPTNGYPYRQPDGIGVHCGTWRTFTHKGNPDTGSCEPNRQLYLGWDIDLDVDNTVRAGSRRQITVSGYHHSYLAKDPEMTKLKLEISFDDGRTWEKLRTKKTDRGEYTAWVKHPKRHHTGAATLRAEGVDTDGNTVKQTIHRAYGIR